MARIGVAGILHETNTFAPGETKVEQFQSQWHVGKESFYDAYMGTKTTMGGVIDAATEMGFELAPLFYTAATPSSMVTADAMDEMLEQLTLRIREQVADLDGLILILHGAMASANIQDVEGAIVEAARSIMGDKPIALTLDMHGNISDQMIEHVDIVVGYDTYPHVDMYERAIEASDLLIQCIGGSARPTRYLAKTNILIAPPMMNTNVAPMQDLMELAFEMEQDPDVLNITVAGGFAFADVNCAQTTFVVTTNDNPDKAKQLGEQLVAWFTEHQSEFKAKLWSLEDAYAETIKNEQYPTVFVESSDNVGGGSAADATHTLKYLVKQKAEKFLAVIYDPEAVQVAVSGGVGSSFSFAIGGKSDRKYGQEPLHGEPVKIEGKVRTIFDGKYTHRGPYMSGQRANMGLTAVIELTETRSTVVLTSLRVAPWDINHIRSVGVIPEDQHIIVVKAAVAWRTAFGDMAKAVYEVDTSGSCSSNLERFTFRNLPSTITIV